MLRRSIRCLLQATTTIDLAIPQQHAGWITSLTDLKLASRTIQSSAQDSRHIKSRSNTYTPILANKNFIPSLHRHFADSADNFNLISLDSGLIRIEGYDESGFIMNDVQVEGSVICYGDIFLLWDVKKFEDITIETLALLDILKPAPDLLILGCGKHIRAIPLLLQQELQKRGVSYEALDTANAVSTFNILNQESRKVVGALLPAAE